MPRRHAILSAIRPSPEEGEAARARSPLGLGRIERADQWPVACSSYSEEGGMSSKILVVDDSLLVLKIAVAFRPSLVHKIQEYIH